MALQEKRLTADMVRSFDADSILFSYVSDSGAMGEAGSIMLLCREESGLIWIATNAREREYGSLKRKLPPFHKLDLKHLPKGWRHDYLGFGNHLFIKNAIYGLYLEMNSEIDEISRENVEQTAMEYWKKEEGQQGLSYNLQWSRKELTPQILGTFCEYYAKMTLASYGASVYTSEVDDHGIDFVVETPSGSFKKIQVKSVRIESTKYVYMEAKYFHTDDPNLYLYLLLLKDGNHPESFIIPAAEWELRKTESLFVYHGNYQSPEYGLNLSEKNREALRTYAIKEQFDRLMK